MIQKIKVTDDIEIILSFQESPLKEVLDSFENAEFINIVTYNLSEDGESLMSIFDSLTKETNINVITNIPNRWDKYYENQKYKAKKSIQSYLKILNPINYDDSFKSFLNFDNLHKYYNLDGSASRQDRGFSLSSTHCDNFALQISSQLVSKALLT